MLRILTPGRHLPLLLALSGLFLLYPLMVELDRLRFFRFVLVGVLVLAAYSVGDRRRQFWVALALGLPATASQIVAYAQPGGTVTLLSNGLTLIFLIFVTTVVFRAVIRNGRVTSDRLAGAVSVYLLIGLIWALLYGGVAALQPGAFDPLVGGGLRGDLAGEEHHFIYYSFVTLTTLGYGDISPQTPWAQTLSWMEAMVGQLFLAILIARLVSLHLVQAGDAGGGWAGQRGHANERGETQ